MKNVIKTFYESVTKGCETTVTDLNVNKMLEIKQKKQQGSREFRFVPTSTTITWQ